MALRTEEGWCWDGCGQEWTERSDGVHKESALRGRIKNEEEAIVGGGYPSIPVDLK